MGDARRGYTTDLSDAEWTILEPLLQKALVDTLGLLLTVVVTKANVSDQVDLKQLLSAISDRLFRLELIKADEAYRGQDFSAWVEQTYRRSLEIVKRPKGVKGCQVQAQRWVVERTLAQVSIPAAGTVCLTYDLGTIAA